MSSAPGECDLAVLTGSKYPSRFVVNQFGNGTRILCGNQEEELYTLARRGTLGIAGEALNKFVSPQKDHM